MAVPPNLTANYEDNANEYLTASILNDLATAANIAGSQFVNLKTYGAAGTGGPDDAGAIYGAVAALSGTGGTVLIPKGTFPYSSFPSLEGLPSIIFQGVGGLSAGAAFGSTLLYTGSGSAPAINGRSSQGLVFQDICLAYNNAAFTGDLLDFSHGISGFDAAYFNINRCTFFGFGVTSARSFVLLDRAITGKFNQAVFNAGVANHVIGRLTDQSHYSVGIGFVDCSFLNGGVLPIRNPGDAWKLDNCSFEALANGNAGGIGWDAAFGSHGFKLDTCWFGDCTTGVGTWVNVSGGLHGGMKFDANYFGAGQNAIVFSAANTKGVSINGGNKFDGQTVSGVTFNGTGQSDFDVWANDFSSVVGTPILKTTTPTNSRFQV